MPASNGAEIESYSIEFNTDSGWQTSGDCDGSNDAQVVLTRTCTVPMTTFSDTFGLTFDQLIQVRVSATNSIGISEYSVVNTTGGRVRQKPG